MTDRQPLIADLDPMPDFGGMADLGAVADLDAVAPGADLAALLDRLDISKVNGYQAVCLAHAAARQIAHDQAHLLALLATIARCQPGGPFAPATRREPDLEAAADEIACGLTLTRVAAGTLVDLAESTVVDHPELHHALAGGSIDLPKLRIVTDAIRPLDPAIAITVVTRILPHAPELTTGQLRSRLARMILHTDPQGATQRREHAESQRRVTHYADADTTATLAATGLPLPQAAAAWHRLDTLAHTARQAGDPRTLDQLRADLLLDLLTAHHPNQHTADPTQHTADPAGTPDPGPRLGSLHVIAPLDTLRGLSHEPGHLPGWGPVAADVLRQLATDPTGETRMQISVLDDQGHLVASAPVARHRQPTAAQARHIRARDLTCRAPGCRTPAHRCDIDHTVAHSDGGPTLVANLGLLCRHHHRMKHQHGFTLTQPAPGQFTWVTPLGHTYRRGEQHPP